VGAVTVAPLSANEEHDLVTRLSLLVGQSFFFGLTVGLLIVAAFALLFSFYGPGALPWVYIAVAIFGSFTFYGFAEAQRRWSLVQVAVVCEMAVAAFLAVAWAGLVFAQIAWLAFAGMVIFSLLLQIGFVIVGGQAGRLLDVRQIKRYFPRIVAGFVVGFMVAGAIAAPLQQFLGATEHLLLAAAIAAVLMLILLLATNARYRTTLAQASETGRPLQAPPLRSVLAKRFVLLIFAYQMLSAMATQLLEFMVMTAAGERFTGSDALAGFYGAYTFALNLTDLLFLALVAGFLLSRFGLKFGLAFNPGGVILLLAVMVTIGVVAGPQSPLFFGLVLLTRILDLTFTDATTRASINATYQALPAHERVTVQTGVEGIGVPLALGLTGVLLLIFPWLGEVTLVHVAAFTLAISLLWIVAAAFVYRDYGANLLKAMRRRALGAAGLVLDNDASLEVVNRLAASEKVSDVRLALDMLQAAGHPLLSELLPTLAKSAQTDIQIEALTRIEQNKVAAALPMVQALSLAPGATRVQGAALRARCVLEAAEAVETVAPFLDDAQVDVRLGAAVGLLRYGSTPGILAVGERLSQWQHSPDADERCFLARVIGDTAITYFYHPLIPLLSDPAPQVRHAALAAAGSVCHARLLPLLVSNLSHPATRSAASDALGAYGTLMLPVVDAALTNNAAPEAEVVPLVRACVQVRGGDVLSLMRRHIDHPSNAVRDQVLAVLSACDFHAQPDDHATLDAAIRREVAQGSQLLQAQADIGISSAAMVTQALAEEVGQVRRRVFLLLSFFYESEAIMRASARLAHSAGAERALAFELLDVTLTSAHKAIVFPLIDPKLELAQRLQQLAPHDDNHAMTCDERLQALISFGGTAWVRACVLYTLAQRDTKAAIPFVEAALGDPDPVVRETAGWSLHKLAPERFHVHANQLRADKDGQVARLAVALTTTTSP